MLAGVSTSVCRLLTHFDNATTSQQRKMETKLNRRAAEVGKKMEYLFAALLTGSVDDGRFARWSLDT